MIKLFFDSETNSKGNFKLPADHPSQPKIVQLAMVLTDENCNEISFAKLLVKPEGFELSPEVIKIHGITNEYAAQNGLPLRIVVGLFYRMAEKADTIHAFNIAYDPLVIRHEMPILKNLEYKFKEKER